MVKSSFLEVSSPEKLPKYLSDVEFYIFKTGEFGSKIVKMNLNNTLKNVIFDENSINSMDLSGDMTKLVYEHGFEKWGIRPVWLWLLDLQTGKQRKLAGWYKDFDEISITNPGFTQDGEQVLFTVTWYDTGKIGLARVNIDGTGLEILDTDIPLTQGPEPSPDGSLIMVICAGYDLLSGDPGFQLCLLDRDGKFIKFLTQRGSGHGSYYFTPDGKKIVYCEYEFGGIFGIINKPKDRFIVQDLETGEFTQLLDWEVGVLAFSPDGNEIVFKAKQTEKSPWAIYIINIDGTNLRHLAYFDDFLEEWYADAREY